ncbi:Replication-associated protein [Taenia solium]
MAGTSSQSAKVCESSVLDASTTSLDETMPLAESIDNASTFTEKQKKWRRSIRNRVQLLFQRLNDPGVATSKTMTKFLFRPATYLPEIDMRYLRKTDSSRSEENVYKGATIVASLWDFQYPPNEKSRQHCARVLFDAVGQPDQIAMRRANSGYEVCELTWSMKNAENIPHGFKNWDLMGRVEITLPNYIDTENGDVLHEDCYPASFRIIDRNCEIFLTKDWKRPNTPFLYTTKELDAVFGKDEKQPSIRYQNKEYCSKTDENAWEFGQPTKPGERNEIKRACLAIREEKNIGEVSTSTKKNINPPPDRDFKTEIYYYHGPPGVGKSRRAYEEAKATGESIYYKPRGDWWDGYIQQPNVIIDDHYGWLKYDELLKIMNRYPYRVPIKGSYEVFNSKRIWITSNIPIEQLYKHSHFNPQAIIRRCTLIEYME